MASAFAGALLAVAGLGACGRGRGAAPVEEDAGPLPEVLAGITGAPMLAGNSLELIENGRVFDELEREIRGARRSVHILTYIWRGEDGPSERIGRALVERKPGVACRIVIDPFGSLKFSSALEQRLTATGCQVRRYDRGPGPSPAARNHRKIAVVDGARAITGGFGIWTSWQGDGRKPEEWRDTAVRVTGPVVAQLQRAFEQSWRESGGAPLGAEAYPHLATQGPTRAVFVASSPREDGASAAELSTRALVASARRRLWIANSYFIPDEALQSALADRARHGVDVRVLVPGPVHDVPPVRAAQRATYEPLLAAGVHIFEYQVSMMHAKTMVIDDRTVVIGSTNIDGLSFERLQEGSLVADAALLAHKLKRDLDEDMRRFSQEITRELWSRREVLPDLARRATSLLSDWL